MNPQEFLTDLQNKVYCRIRPSPIHGVGVFAIRNIPSDFNPMQESRNFDWQELPSHLVRDNPDIPYGLKQIVIDMCPEEDGNFLIPPYSLNELGLAYYLNHSDNPNMVERDGDFVTLHPILAGEELTVNYETYGNLNL